MVRSPNYLPRLAPVSDKAPIADAPGRPVPASGGGAPGLLAVEAVQSLTRASKVLERASGGLSLAHYRVLAAVAAGDARASRVAARLALGKPTVSASVEALSARGLLVRSGVACDQRAIQLSLTAAGADVLEGAQLSMTSTLEDLAARTGRRDEVISALVALGAAIDEMAAGPRP
jgi:DNA-binding MarR family transcriptional regulator